MSATSSPKLDSIELHDEPAVPIPADSQVTTVDTTILPPPPLPASPTPSDKNPRIGIFEGDDDGGKGKGKEKKEDVATEGNFLEVIVNSLKRFFDPKGGQIFTLQFPGRFLEISEYAWDSEGAGIYGQFIKPVAVNEAEFRLVDQMYDVAEVVSGPKSINLSQVYEQLLNNLLPIFQDTGLAKQQNEIRRWLLKDVKAPAWVKEIVQKQEQDPDAPDVPNPTEKSDIASQIALPNASFATPNRLDDGKVNRIELSNALMMEYLEAKQKWELERDGYIEKAMGIDPSTPESQRNLNNLTRKLAHITAVREAQLSAKYSDAVIRGFSHTVREYMGYMDMKSSAEFLQEAKDSLREAAMSSLDGSLKVYPVQLTPINWWQGLSTHFTLEDLTQNPDLIKNQIDAKSEQVDLLNKQLVALTFGKKGDADQLRETLAAAESEMNKTRATLAAAFPSTVFSIAQAAIDRMNVLNVKQLESLVQPYGYAVATAAFNSLKDGMEKLASAQAKVNDATRAWTDAAARLALAEATDTRQQQKQIELTIDTLKKEIAELTARYQALNKGGDALPAPVPKDKEPSIEDVPILPGGNDETSGGSRWQEIVMHHMVQSDYSYQQSESSASTSDSRCNLWFYSKTQSSQKISGSSQAKVQKSKNEVWVGFRTTLVTVDRAGWFRPQFFQETKSYYHINPELKWTKWPEGVKKMEDLKAGGESNFSQLNQYLLPGYTVGFILCKDITIKIAYDTSQDEAGKTFMEENAQSSGGVLCWSYSNGSSSNQSENSHSFQACSDGCVIRIPGPQILGYIVQLTPNDDTVKMPQELPNNFFIPDSDYDEILGGDERRNRGQEDIAIPPHAEPPQAEPPNPQTHLLYDQLDEILKKANIPQEAMESVHSAITKELGIVSAESVPKN